MRRTTGALIASLGPVIGALLIGLSGCGGAAGSSFDGAVYRKGPLAFQIGTVPAGWRSVELNHATLAYRDDAHGASVLLNGRCHRPDESTPLVALTNHLLIGST
jgi:hypothetical protein